MDLRSNPCLYTCRPAMMFAVDTSTKGLEQQPEGKRSSRRRRCKAVSSAVQQSFIPRTISEYLDHIGTGRAPTSFYRDGFRREPSWTETTLPALLNSTSTSSTHSRGQSGNSITPHILAAQSELRVQEVLAELHASEARGSASPKLTSAASAEDEDCADIEQGLGLRRRFTSRPSSTVNDDSSAVSSQSDASIVSSAEGLLQDVAQHVVSVPETIAPRLLPKAGRLSPLSVLSGPSSPATSCSAVTLTEDEPLVAVLPVHA